MSGDANRAQEDRGELKAATELEWFTCYCILVALLLQPPQRPWWHRLMEADFGR